MDALPIEEETEEDFASVNGCMHACGHDMHTAMLLGAAKLLKMHEEEIEGTVKLMFQPAEEIFEGSRNMIESGLLNDPDVDAALMVHVTAGMPFEAGTVGVADAGVSAPAADYFDIFFFLFVHNLKTGFLIHSDCIIAFLYRQRNLSISIPF